MRLGMGVAALAMIATLVVVPACKGKRSEPAAAAGSATPAAPATPYGPAIARATQYRDEVCACKDTDCLATARKAASTWQDTWKAPAAKPTDAEQVQITAVSKAAGECETKLKAAGLGDVIAKMTDFKRRMCTCPDQACGDAITKEMATWTEDMSKTYGRDTRPSADQVKEMKAIGDEYGQCYQRAVAGTGLPPGPATP